MEYQFAQFQNDQYEEFCVFLKAFSHQAYQPGDFVGKNWWKPSNPLRGFVFLAHTAKEVASRCFITGRELGGQDCLIPCYEIGGTRTLPWHQRKGLFSLLVRKAVQVGFDTEAQLIYGTPGKRSVPGYRKLNFSFIDQENSYLVLQARPLRPVLRKLGFQQEPIIHLKSTGEGEPISGSIAVEELTFEQYLKMTGSFPRMNYSDEAYIRRRFNPDRPGSARRFFWGSGKKGEFHCALRDHELSFLKVIMVSEYFLNGQLDSSTAKFAFLEKIASGFYRHYDGVYLKSQLDPRISSFINMINYRLVPHRKMPICYVSQESLTEETGRALKRLVPLFQLTDCDMG